MHCLGAVTGGTPSPNGIGSRGGILSVFRALGVLVCEGRIQGPPRGYKEGPHCAPPMQAIPADHVCEEDSYLCERYLLLVREITDRTAIGSYLCVEVVLCSDCPCGLAKATCKNPICPVPSLSISPWQQSSEMLLEYWCICAVPSKNPETMNFQGLYQAVRSRLHFSQVAAWWSRSNGSEPSYIATRVVQYNEDNLRKFRGTPVEHTFPLAGSGDGASIKVTVWALPRMEEVPILVCPIHPTTAKEKDEEGVVARALTPTKGIPVPTAPQNPEGLVMPALVDDRLQTPCNKPGKHHCRCEEEDGSPPSPSIPRPNGERKRRRSLPCGPADVNSCVTFQPMPLPSVQESTSRESAEFSPSSSYHSTFSDAGLLSDGQGQAAERQGQARYEQNGVGHWNNVNADDLDRCFRTQLNIEEREGNVEKRYKRTLEGPEETRSSPDRADDNRSVSVVRGSPSPDRGKMNGTSEPRQERNGLFENLIPFNSSLPWSFVESWNNSAANGKCAFQSLRAAKDSYLNEASRVHTPRKDPSTLSLDSLAATSPFRDPGSSEYGARTKVDLMSACTVHQSCTKSGGKSASAVSPANEALPEPELENGGTKSRGRQRDLSQLMSKLSFAEEKEKVKEEGGFLDWFSRVPGRVLGVSPSNGLVDSKAKATSHKAQELQQQQQQQQQQYQHQHQHQHQHQPQQQHNANNEVKFKNCNLELSQREFDEVLAVLRAGTPSGRKRAPVKTVKRRDRGDRSLDESVSEKCLSKCAANGLENGDDASAGYIVAHAKSSCEVCRNRLCKRADHLTPDKSTIGVNHALFAKGIHYNCANSETRGIKCNSPDKRANTAVDCLQNVSNKADVLLGAILRTSKERKGLSDISNGTRPRTVLPAARADGEYSPHTMNGDKGGQDSRIIVPFEDERSSPLSLNKRLNRFRQLFKKEQEKKVTPDCYTQDTNLPNVPLPRLSTPNLIPNHNNIQPNLHEPKHPRDGSRAKRKIDFSKFAEESGAPDKRSQETSEFSTNGAHQNSSIHSTNFTEDSYVHAANGTLQCRNCQGNRGRLHSTNDSGTDEGEDVLDETVGSFKVRKDPDTISISSTTPLINGHSPPGSRCNNLNNGTYVEDEETFDKAVPSAIEQERFRRSLENAASMVFHSRTGLPLTSSPAPLRRGSCCFDYDSSLNSVSSKRSALFELNTPPSPGAVSLEETDKETENAGEGEETPKRRTTSRNRPQSHALLGSFEESALNGRLEPVSTVHGFTAELGASGSFCPKHRKLPVTVFFYTLGDNDKVSTPYLAHINLGKKGYAVPKNGTIQVTLLNPLGTVVKMFVVLYDLSDMPPRSHTFLRQRTLRDKTLRYLVHLRFMSNKSGRISLHTDIRMIICRKSDVDTASDFGSEPPKELRSYIHGPTNPKFSPRC